MRKTATKQVVLSLIALLTASCQQIALQQAQAEYTREHVERCLQEYREHVEKQQKAMPRMQEGLAKAEKALWRWVYDCDCDESLIPGDMKLSHAEFEEARALLKQALPMPPLPPEAFISEAPKVALAPNGEVLKPVIIPPWMGCGGVSPVLIFLDGHGEECYFWDFSMATPTSRVQESLRKKDTWLHPHIQMPDTAYEQLRNLPTTVKVRQVDAAFQELLKRQH